MQSLDRQAFQKQLLGLYQRLCHGNWSFGMIHLEFGLSSVKCSGSGSQGLFIHTHPTRFSLSSSPSITIFFSLSPWLLEVQLEDLKVMVCDKPMSAQRQGTDGV